MSHKIILVGRASREHFIEAFTARLEPHRICCRRFDANEHRPTLCISDGMPQTGGGESAGQIAPVAAASDEDDGDGDGDPDSDRRRSKKKPTASPSFPPALIGLAHLTHYTGFGRSRIYQLLRAGFPPPIKIGKSSRWVLAEVDTWIASQAAERRPNEGWR